MTYSINEIIRILRSLRGYKQSYMAAKMGITQQDYSHLEKHGKKITDKQLSLICEILEVNEDFIRHFDPTLLFKQIQKDIDSNGIPENLLNGIGDKDEVVIVLKTHIERLQENLHGLRKQNLELNETIRDLREALLKKLPGGVKV